jgi:hypothetical protein
MGIKQEFSSPITPQQNRVVERKNRVIQEMARVRIHSKNLAQHFWEEAKYFKTFGSKCYILCDRENLGKFDSKSDEGIFLGYSTNSRAYKVFNKRTETVMEFINVEKLNGLLILTSVCEQCATN